MSPFTPLNQYYYVFMYYICTTNVICLSILGDTNEILVFKSINIYYTIDNTN